MSTLASGIATVPPTWGQTEILAFATKLDPANAAQLAALIHAGLLYGIPKIFALLAGVSALKPFAAEVSAAQALVTSQV